MIKVNSFLDQEISDATQQLRILHPFCNSQLLLTKNSAQHVTNSENWETGNSKVYRKLMVLYSRMLLKPSTLKKKSLETLYKD